MDKRVEVRLKPTGERRTRFDVSHPVEFRLRVGRNVQVIALSVGEALEVSQGIARSVAELLAEENGHGGAR